MISTCEPSGKLGNALVGVDEVYQTAKQTFGELSAGAETTTIGSRIWVKQPNGSFGELLLAGDAGNGATRLPSQVGVVNAGVEIANEMSSTVDLGTVLATHYLDTTIPVGSVVHHGEYSTAIGSDGKTMGNYLVATDTGNGHNVIVHQTRL